MAKLAMDRLRKKYGNFKSYGELAELIIRENHRKTATKITRMSNNVFAAESARVKGKEKVINIPDLPDVLSRRIDSIKSKERGKWMAENLKNKITSDLRNILKQPSYMNTRGRTAGTLKNQVIKDFQDKIKKTFEGYTKIDPEIGVPSNIRNIAVTEVRNVVNNTKEAYMNELLRRNDDLYITKTFIHNGRLSKNPRMHHKEANGITIPKAESFKLYNREKGRVVVMMYPHDPNLPPEETIGCSCEVVYRVQRKSKVQQWKYKEGD